MRKLFFCFFIFGFFLINPFFTLAKEYDFYVDASVKKNGDGSKKEPFKEISKALKEAKDRDKETVIYIKEGRYKENFTITKAVELMGEKREEVVVEGSITMNDNTLLENLTVSKSNTPITIQKDANATIKNCTIEDFISIGINSLPGSGTLNVSGCEISKGQGKGLYIQRGKEIEIISNEITGNGEEGVDIRSKVIGNVNSNYISDNGESGIEVIIGSSHLDIENNKIKDNGSSGIATQFYEDFDKDGNIDVYNNKIINNKKYGFDCNRPQGGSSGSSYWRDSIEMKGNEIKSNKGGSISSVCKFIEAVDEQEEKDNTIDESGYNEKENTNYDNGEQKNKELIGDEQKIQAQEQRKEQEQIKRREKLEKLGEIKNLLEESQKIYQDVEKGVKEIKNQGQLESIVFGVEEAKADELMEKTKKNDKKLLKIGGLLNQVDLESEEEAMLNEIVLSKQKGIESQQEFLEQKKNSFSLLEWLRNHFVLMIGLILSLVFLTVSFKIYKKRRKKVYLNR